VLTLRTALYFNTNSPNRKCRREKGFAERRS